MPSDAIGTERSNAVYRIVGLVYLFTIYPFVAGIGFVGGFIAMLIDVVVRLFTDEGYDGIIWDWGERLFMWPVNQLTYIVVNDPDAFQWTP